MVVFSLYVMILITFLSQSTLKLVQGLDCYQCEHSGLSAKPCQSKPCDSDQFHKELKERYEHATQDLKMETDNLIEIEELCFRRLDRPIPFDKTVRGCYLDLKYRGESTSLESKSPAIYEVWELCKTDNCNNWDLPEDNDERASGSSSNSSSRSRQSRIKPLLSLLAALIVLLINYHHCFYHYPRIDF